MVNKTALVVGGASGIGAALTQQLLNADYQKVYIADRNKPNHVSDKLDHIQMNLICDNVEQL